MFDVSLVGRLEDFKPANQRHWKTSILKVVYLHYPVVFVHGLYCYSGTREKQFEMHCLSTSK
jgi:hypothetical protein